MFQHRLTRLLIILACLEVILSIVIFSGYKETGSEVLLPISVAIVAVDLPEPMNYNFPIVPIVPVVKDVNVVKLVQKKPSAHLIIPKIGVNAVIVNMGLTSAGAMAVPNNNVDVGWYSLGTSPGQIGSAVIGGHNRWNQTDGIFVRLDELVVGDLVSVVDEHDVSTSFIVKKIASYNPTDDATDIFLSSSGAHLNLITCSGVWDSSTNSYTKRLIIFTDIVEQLAIERKKKISTDP